MSDFAIDAMLKEAAIFALAGIAIMVVFAFLGFSGNIQAAYSFIGPALLAYIIGAIAWVLATAIREDKKKARAIAAAFLDARISVENAASRNGGRDWDFSDAVVCKYADNNGCLAGIEAASVRLSMNG